MTWRAPTWPAPTGPEGDSDARACGVEDGVGWVGEGHLLCMAHVTGMPAVGGSAGRHHGAEGPSGLVLTGDDGGGRAGDRHDVAGGCHGGGIATLGAEGGRVQRLVRSRRYWRLRGDGFGCGRLIVALLVDGNRWVSAVRRRCRGAALLGASESAAWSRSDERRRATNGRRLIPLQQAWKI